MISPFHYEPNILSNPRTHYGTWTPDGWRVHKKRWLTTKPVEVLLSGDGTRTRFGLPTVFLEDAHDVEDKFTDGGIYPSELRVEYPVGRPRWAISHTFLGYPFADKTLYEQEYVWNRETQTLKTFFRQHVVCEEAVTDNRDGMTVRIKHRPISRVVVGNKAYPHCNSAVRGVWSAPDKRGTNFYTRERLMRLPATNAVYIRVPHTPVTNCLGLWKARAADRAFFDKDGNCIDRAGLRKAGIPLEAPGVTAMGYSLRSVHSRFYSSKLALMAEEELIVQGSLLGRLRVVKGIPFREQGVGYAGWGNWDHDNQLEGVKGHYCVTFDFNHNGVVDEDDEETLRCHIGQRLRVNYYTGAYYGWDWLSVGVSLNAEMQGGEPMICLWEQGAGYDAEGGVIRLHSTPGPNQRVCVEYHYDRPADAGRDNIRVLLRQEVSS
ncbi:MAG: hypothetical protein EXS18_04625 [Verrucomicrobiae bacterium]|nr:hypothetical protein [Verrucomicrobiae bacterium]